MKKFDIVDIRKALYEGTSIDDIKRRHIENLRAEGSVYNLLYANKLEENEKMLSKKNLHELDREFQSLKNHLRTWAQDYNVHLYLNRRKKDWVGTNEKIQLYLRKGQSLDKVLDLLGFRIILANNSTDKIEDIYLCYELQNEIMDFFITQKHCLFLEAEPKIDINFDPEKRKKIIIPESTQKLLDSNFVPFVKDYIKNPKSNGYQSLHSVARKPNGLTFELQIRTYAMDLRAEYGTGEHTLYKQSRYSELEDFNIDYKKIHIPGFTVLWDGKINDIVGLRKSVDPFNFL